jgi:hypothetical protein
MQSTATRVFPRLDYDPKRRMFERIEASSGPSGAKVKVRSWSLCAGILTMDIAVWDCLWSVCLYLGLAIQNLPVNETLISFGLFSPV